MVANPPPPQAFPRRAPPFWRGLACLLLGALVAVLGVAYVSLAQVRANAPGSNDFFTFYGSAQRALAGKSPYGSVPASPPTGHPCHRHSPEQLEAASTQADHQDLALELRCRPANLNPPAFSVLMMPLAWMSLPAASTAWAVCSTACAIIAVWLVLDALSLPPSSRPGARGFAFLASAAGLLAWFPTFANFLFGQVSLVLLLPIVLSWRALRSGRPVQAGAWLGLLMGLKVFFGLFLLPLWLMRQRRALASALSVLGLTLLVGLWPAGLQGYADYVQGLGSVHWTAVNWNGSLQGYVSRILGGSGNHPWLNAPLAARGITWLADGTVLWFLCVALRRLPSAPSSPQVHQADALFGLTLPAMLLLSPLGWLYYDPWLMLPAALVWTWGRASQRPRAVTLGLVLLATMAAAPRTFTLSYFINTPRTWLLDWGFYTYLLLGLFGMAVALSRSAQPPPPRSKTPDCKAA